MTFQLLEIGLTVVGLVFETIGAIRIGMNDVIDLETARTLANSRLDENTPAIQEILKRSRNAEIGLAFVIAGTAILVMAALLPLFGVGGTLN